MPDPVLPDPVLPEPAPHIRHARLFLALIVPAIAVLVPMPFLYGSERAVCGVPVALVWLFCCIPLTTLCLYLAERLSGGNA